MPAPESGHRRLDLHDRHRLVSAHRCTCGWEGDSAITHVWDAIVALPVAERMGALGPTGHRAHQLEEARDEALRRAIECEGYNPGLSAHHLRMAEKFEHQAREAAHADT